MSDLYGDDPQPKSLRDRVEAGQPKPIRLGGHQPHVATVDDWKYAYHRKVAEFAAETLRTSQLTAERDALLAEVERLRDMNGKLALTIRACPEGHHDANLAHARAERDQLRAEVERLKANQPDGGEWTIDYGHLTVEVGWIGEPRGLYYASHQRSVWLGPAERVQDVLATPDPDSATQTHHKAV